MEIFSMVLSLLSGVALFLFGMSLMGDGLKQVAGNKLEAFLYKMTNTPLKGVALGTGVTSVIQSSSATTVMVIGFVNSGMMKLKQAIGIIMGANIGTSITGWILCLSYIDGSNGIAKILSSATIAAVVAVIGTIMRMVCKRTTHKNIGNIMLGFAILMTGMQTMNTLLSLNGITAPLIVCMPVIRIAKPSMILPMFLCVVLLQIIRMIVPITATTAAIVAEDKIFAIPFDPSI